MPNDFLEKTLEDIIYENRNIIHTRGLPELKRNAFRQVILPSGKKIDILGFEIQDGNLSCDIYELKRETINADAICQAYGYFQELKSLTKNHFRTFNAKIFMVGKKYEPVSVLDALDISVQVFTYQYQMDGIRFLEIHNPYIYHQPNECFSLGLWSFGYVGLTFTKEQSSVNFQSSYENYINDEPEFQKRIASIVLNYANKPVLLLPAPQEPLSVPVKEKYITTEYFPEPLSWTPEFSKEIPHNNIFEDLGVDRSDFEHDDWDFEPNNCDHEPSGDDEEDPDEKWFVKEWDGKQEVKHPALEYLKQQNQPEI